MTGGQYKSRLRLLKYNAAKAAILQAPAIQNTILQTDTVLQQEVTKEADERMFRDAIGECISQASVSSDEREEACPFGVVDARMRLTIPLGIKIVLLLSHHHPPELIPLESSHFCQSQGVLVEC